MATATYTHTFLFKAFPYLNGCTGVLLFQVFFSTKALWLYPLIWFKYPKYLWECWFPVCLWHWERPLPDPFPLPFIGLMQLLSTWNVNSDILYLFISPLINLHSSIHMYMPSGIWWRMGLFDKDTVEMAFNTCYQNFWEGFWGGCCVTRLVVGTSKDPFDLDSKDQVTGSGFYVELGSNSTVVGSLKSMP